MITQSGELLFFRFWDNGCRKALTNGLIAVVLMGGAIGAEYYYSGRVLFAGIVVFPLMLVLWSLWRDYALAGQCVWIDLKNGLLAIGTEKCADQYYAAHCDSVFSRLEIFVSRGGCRSVGWLSVFLHCTDGEIEIARFSDSSRAINDWDDHAQAKRLRELIAASWRLKDEGVREGFSEMQEKDQRSMDAFLGAKIASTEVGKWVGVVVKFVVFIFALPLVVLLFSARAPAGDKLGVFVGLAILWLCWFAVDVVGKKQRVREQMSRMALGYGILGVLFALLSLISAAPDWGAVISFGTSGAGALAYWWRFRD